MYKSIILPLAKEDIQDAAKWYSKQQEGLGKRFIAEVREKIHFIRQNPEALNEVNSCKMQFVTFFLK